MNPQFQKSKNARLVSNEHFSKEIKKLRFLPSKMGGRLIHGIDLYTGKYGILITRGKNSVANATVYMYWLEFRVLVYHKHVNTLDGPLNYYYKKFKFLHNPV